jgi:hypothetical protein
VASEVRMMTLLATAALLSSASFFTKMHKSVKHIRISFSYDTS